jgi:hypothetical protein
MGFLKDAYNRLVEPPPSIDEIYVPDDEDLDTLDFSNWVPPQQHELGDDRLMEPSAEEMKKLKNDGV